MIKKMNQWIVYSGAIMSLVNTASAHGRNYYLHQAVGGSLHQVQDTIVTPVVRINARTEGRKDGSVLSRKIKDKR